MQVQVQVQQPVSCRVVSATYGVFLSRVRHSGTERVLG